MPLYGGDFARQTWSPLLFPGEQAEPTLVPVHLRHLRFMLDADMDGLRVPFSSVMYPPNLRAVVARSFGTDPDFHLGEPPGDPVLAAVRSRMTDVSGLPAVDQAALFAAINCLSEQRLLPDLLEQCELTSDTAEGAAAWYQAARGLHALGGYDDFAESSLAHLGESDHDSVACASLIQLGAVYLRQTPELERGLEAIMAAEKRHADADWAHPALRPLILSRLRRLQALFATRVKDLSAAEDHMRSCIAAHEELAKVVGGVRTERGATYLQLLAAENHKTVCEAGMKLAAMQDRPDVVEEWCRGLLSLDPREPMSWRNVTECLALVGDDRGALQAATTALSLGVNGTERVNALVRAAVDQPRRTTSPSFGAFLGRASAALLPVAPGAA
jgi:hypothetical protein